MFGPTQTNLTPPPFIKVHVLSQEREQSCICMLVVSILSLFYDFAIYFGIVWLCVLFLYLFFNLESSRKASIWRMQVNFIVLISFTYIGFFLQIQNVHNSCKVLLKRAETNVVLIVLKGVLYYVCTYIVTVSNVRPTWITYQIFSFTW